MILYFDVYYAEDYKLKQKRFETFTAAMAFANDHVSHLIQRVEFDDDYSNKRVDNLVELAYTE